MTSVNPDAAFLGKVLRRARLAAGIKSQEELARKFGYERTAIAKAESGYTPPSPELARLYAQEFPELNALVKSGLIEEWAEHVKQNGGSFPKNFGPWVDAEKKATALFYWAPTLIPGLFQTESYARVILATEPSANDEPLEDRLADRMGRQDVLTRPQPPTVAVVVAEAVLHRCVGSPEIMHQQLVHLAEVSDQYSHVMIQVVPSDTGAHAGLGGAVSIADHGEGTIVYQDSFTSGPTTGEPEIVTRVRLITDMLRYEALPGRASRERIEKVTEEWKSKI